jgi:hypothetical protein
VKTPLGKMKKTLLLIIINLFASLVTVHVYGQNNYLDTAFARFLNAKYASCLINHLPDSAAQDPGGYTIDSTCSIIQHVDSLNISRLEIQNLEGIEYFTSLTYLNCSNNQIYESPALPSTLTYLDISNNADDYYGPYGYLPPLPNSLTYLDCSSNFSPTPILTLPALPPSLEYLKCSNNSLGTLPSLPNSLIYLDCSSQADYVLEIPLKTMGSLPALPPSLTYLDCSSNALSSLPPLPASLTYLDCSGMGSLSYQYSGNSLLPTLFCLPRLPQSLNFLAIPSSVSCLPDSVSNLQIKVDSLVWYAYDFFYDGGHIVTSMPICTSNCINNSNTILCPAWNSTTLIAGLVGSNYQWQMSTDSFHFFNINDNLQNDSTLGTNTDTLQLNGIKTMQNGYQYRCLVDGDTSIAYTIKFVNTWTGTDNTTWENPENWSCGSLPDSNTDVIISNGTVILSSNQSVRSLTVSPNASFTIAPGYNLTITH